MPYRNFGIPLAPGRRFTTIASSVVDVSYTVMTRTPLSGRSVLARIYEAALWGFVRNGPSKKDLHLDDFPVLDR
jgi:hypothetical protein